MQIPRKLIAVLSILTFFVIISYVIGYHISAPKYKGEISDHFDGQTFQNQSGVKAKELSDVLKWMLNRERDPWKEIKEYSYGSISEYDRNDENLTVTFVNHSTFLIQHKGISILTDPVWSQRTSPFQWAGPKRMRPAGIKFEDLPKIDLVLISHNHYDHLDMPTMKRIWKKDKPTIICPLGISEYLNNHGMTTAIDLDWWQNEQFKSFKIHCVPSQHFSGRGMFDRDATLWAGFVIEADSRKVYFAGDTGYDQAIFKKIASVFGEMDLSLIPIGAYKPRWFMSPIHVSPAEAAQIHLDVNSVKSLAMHFGTFPLADDGQYDPQNDLKIALEENKIDETSFIIPIEGETYSY